MTDIANLNFWVQLRPVVVLETPPVGATDSTIREFNLQNRAIRVYGQGASAAVGDNRAGSPVVFLEVPFDRYAVRDQQVLDEAICDAVREAASIRGEDWQCQIRESTQYDNCLDG
ncbi:MAG: hypothetical protein HKL81_10775 [Acidimicrobiaceae bacterium]|nr:hypothetical protein [Acidimicrobiaceae bacterium]